MVLSDATGRSRYCCCENQTRAVALLGFGGGMKSRRSVVPAARVIEGVARDGSGADVSRHSLYPDAPPAASQDQQ